MRAVTETLRSYGRLDILVNNAGTAAAKPFEQIDDESWASDLDLKLFGAIRFACGRPSSAEFRRRCDY